MKVILITSKRTWWEKLGKLLPQVKEVIWIQPANLPLTFPPWKEGEKIVGLIDLTDPAIKDSIPGIALNLPIRVTPDRKIGASPSSRLREMIKSIPFRITIRGPTGDVTSFRPTLSIKTLEEAPDVLETLSSQSQKF